MCSGMSFPSPRSSEPEPVKYVLSPLRYESGRAERDGVATFGTLSTVPWPSG